MEDKLVFAIKFKRIIVLSVEGSNERVVFEPHRLYRDPMKGGTYLIGNRHGTVEKTSQPVWDNINVSRISDVGISDAKFSIDPYFASKPEEFLSGQTIAMVGW